jgi:hypothetical protein
MKYRKRKEARGRDDIYITATGSGGDRETDDIISVN